MNGLHQGIAAIGVGAGGGFTASLIVGGWGAALGGAVGGALGSCAFILCKVLANTTAPENEDRASVRAICAGAVWGGRPPLQDNASGGHEALGAKDLPSEHQVGHWATMDRPATTRTALSPRNGHQDGNPPEEVPDSVKRVIAEIVSALKTDKVDAARARRAWLHGRRIPMHGSALEKRQHHAKQAIKEYIGQTISTRLAAFEAGEQTLNYLHSLGLESAVAILMDADNECVHAAIWFGDEHSVEVPPDEVVDLCARYDAKKMLLMHNHPTDNATPSDADILYAASLCEHLPEGITLVDDLVWCTRRVTSVIETKRFKSLIREY